MTEQIIEVAIRSAKPSRSDAEFHTRMDRTVAALLQVDGVGPERAFQAFATEPAQDRSPAVGMTRYASLAHQKKATRNIGVLRNFVGFLRVMDLHVNVFLRPDSPDFDLSTFAREPGVALEFAACKPAAGVSEAEFLAARGRFLASLDAHDEVLRSHTFTTAGGFKAKDSLVHIIEYRDRSAVDALADRRRDAMTDSDFQRMHVPSLITFASAPTGQGDDRA